MSTDPPPYSGPQSYPSPYAGPPPVGSGYPSPAGDARGGRRAGTLMFVLGPLLILFGGCLAGMAAVLPHVPTTPELNQLRAQTAANLPPGVTLEVVAGACGAVLLLTGLTLTGLAAFVYRGRRGATIAALVVNGLITLYLLLNLLVALSHPAAAVNGLLGVCVGVVVTAAFALLLVWLIAALRGRPVATDPYQQYMAQYYQYQQAAQTYGQGGDGQGGDGQGGGYGYAAQVPPPIDPAPPPDGAGSDGPS